MTSDVSSTTISVPPMVLGQLAYHVRCAAGLSADEHAGSGVPHAVLSWALLEALGGAPLRQAVAALDLPDDVGDPRSLSSAASRRTAEELALQLCAHFTSEGHHELATLYQDAYQVLANADSPTSSFS